MMFITRSQHRRSSVGRVKKGIVNDSGLGIVVKKSTRFDPRRMVARYEYWYKKFYDEVVQAYEKQYRDAGFEGVSGLGQGGISPLPLDLVINPMKLVTKPLEKIPVVGQFVAPLTMVFDVFTLGLTKILPKIPVIGKIFESIFGGGKPKIPWDAIHDRARELAGPAARKAARDEEEYRIAHEQEVTEEKQITAIEKTSQLGAKFQLPEGATGIKHGALMLALKGGPVEVRNGSIQKIGVVKKGA